LATEVWFQISVASVSKPVGRSTSVAGSSFMHVRNTSIAPASTPGPASGRVTRRNTDRVEAPMPRAAASRVGLTRSRDALVDPTACGRKRITYATTSSASVW